jgi:hypothetical protein
MNVHNLSPHDSECGGEIVELYAVANHAAFSDESVNLNRFVVVMTGAGFYRVGALYSVWCDHWMKCAYSEEMKTKMVEAAIRGDRIPPRWFGDSLPPK